MPPKEYFHGQYHHPDEEEQDGDPVDAMHVFYPLCLRSIRVLFAQVQILCYLVEYAHKKEMCNKYNPANGLFILNSLKLNRIFKLSLSH